MPRIGEHAMLQKFFAILICSLSGEVYPHATGTIHGVVLNGSRSGEPIADAEVHLRAGLNGVFEPVDKTKTDAFGKFSFQQLPIDSTITFLPGASHQGVHYPGQRVRFGVVNKVAQVKIMAYDAVTSVSPLTAERHEINVAAGEQLLEIDETLIVSNRSSATYVGQSQDGTPADTLRLSIPPNFDRITFDREFYGRRFRIVDHNLVTDMPWPPGERELKFTYRVPLEESGGLFRRPMDLPCAHLSVRLGAHDTQNVVCNLPQSVSGERDTVFASVNKIPANFTIELQIGKRPVPWMQYGRWGSLGILCLMVVGTVVVHRLRARQITEQVDVPNSKGNRRCRPLNRSQRAA